MSTQLIFAETLYDGTAAPPLRNCLIEYGEGRIRSMFADTHRVPPSAKTVEIAAPGFIDLQVNGAADTQFNDEPTPEALERIAAGARKGGVAYILPTFITAFGEAWHGALHAVRVARVRRMTGILGLHLEGPFLSRHKPGIHPQLAIRSITETDLSVLEDADIPLLITLAPEEQQQGIVKRLTEAGAVVFAGHSVATASQIEAAVVEGLRGVTHLWNAMPAPKGRMPGIVVRALTHKTLFASIIADGHHVDPLNLSLAAAMMQGRLFLVTDSMRSFAGQQDHFDLMGTAVKLRGGRLTAPDGTLAGAHLGMDAAVRTMVGHAGLTPQAAIAMATTVPACVMGLEGKLGRIAAGHRASFTFLDSGLYATGTCVDGQMHI